MSSPLFDEGSLTSLQALQLLFVGIGGRGKMNEEEEDIISKDLVFPEIFQAPKILCPDMFIQVLVTEKFFSRVLMCEAEICLACGGESDGSLLRFFIGKIHPVRLNNRGKQKLQKMMTFRPKYLQNPFFIVPPLFLILSTFFSLSHVRQNDTADLQPDGVLRLVKRKMEETKQKNYSMILAENQTKRPDPTDNFRIRFQCSSIRGGGCNLVRGGGYISSFCLLLFLLLPSQETLCYSQYVYAISLVCLIVFSITAIVGSSVMFSGEKRFVDSVKSFTDYLVNKGISIYESLIRIQNLLISAKNIVLNKKYVPDDLKQETDNANKMIDSIGTLPRVKAEDITNEINEFLQHVNTALIILASIMLVLAFLGFSKTPFGSRHISFLGGMFFFGNINPPSLLAVKPIQNLRSYPSFIEKPGLIAYNADSDMSFGSLFELGILAIDKPIKIDFNNVTKASNITGFLPLCSSFEGNGKVTLKNQVSANVCVASRHGQFDLVVKSPQSLAVRKKMQ
ncbi:hypothetical protein F3Y22_tig00000340pilonHSYRG01217 [Hibiscus syriacus]|uniref:Uncharacterized protein n=1 Tax=Hibiscus syriacus TaxID=106335 RepID=A0A6A3D2H1_HIBSY|nr:hypothetical protein F3Y22_tig00000340pilonHSYRG01217 [Hibiscus syriacus]